MKLKFHITVIFLIFFIASSQAALISPGFDIDKATLAMKKSGYSNVELWMESENPDIKFMFWKIEDKTLIFSYSQETKKIMEISFWQVSKTQTFDLNVYSFDSVTGRVIIQTKLPQTASK